MVDHIELETPADAATSCTRRLFCAASAAGAVTLLAAACGDDNDADTTAAATRPDNGAAVSDVETAKFAAGLEILAVDTHRAVLDAVTEGKLGQVPPAVAEYIKTAMAHHQEHLKAWNAVVAGAGEQEVKEPDAKLKPVVDGEFAKVNDVAGTAKLALMLEDIAAQTYLKALPTLQDKAAIKLAGSIQAVDQQHAAILLFALGMYPVPEVFQKTDKAATPA